MPHPHTILGSESGELKDKGTNRNVTIFYFLLVSINSGVHRAHGTKTGYMFIMCVDTMNEAVSGLPHVWCTQLSSRGTRIMSNRIEIGVPN